VLVTAVLVAAAAIGVAVGLLGGGGSVLSVPLLALGLGLEPASAITTSLLVVAVTSLAALIPHARAGRVRWRVGLAFGPAGLAGALAGGRIGAALPGSVVMLLFGLALAASAATTLLRRPPAVLQPVAAEPLRVLAIGLAVGLVTGLVGVGGGVVIVPAMIYAVGLPVHAAIGTSLLVISMSSAAGAVGRLGHVDVDWSITLGFAAIAGAGAALGACLAGRVEAEPLRRGFGWLVVAVAALVLVDQVL
jgi:hypothetical protein